LSGTADLMVSVIDPDTSGSILNVIELAIFF